MIFSVFLSSDKVHFHAQLQGITCEQSTKRVGDNMANKFVLRLSVSLIIAALMVVSSDLRKITSSLESEPCLEPSRSKVPSYPAIIMLPEMILPYLLLYCRLLNTTLILRS